MLATSEVTKQALSISIKEVLDECVERLDGGGWQTMLGADNFVMSFWERWMPMDHEYGSKPAPRRK